jgi:exopolysaccharide production protein ExoZ
VTPGELVADEKIEVVSAVREESEARRVKDRLESLQSARALAAMLVVVDHSIHEIAGVGIDAPWIWLRSFPWSFGVDIFFFLSGFLMYLTTEQRMGQPYAAKEFLKRRFARIAPIYWLYTAILTAVLVVAPALAQTTVIGIKQFAGSILFVPYQIGPGHYRPILMQGWTLNYEMYFYLLMGIGIATWRFHRNIFLVLTSFFLLTSLLGLVLTLPPPLGFWFRAICLEFVAGMLLAKLYVAGIRIPCWSGAPLIGLALTMLAFVRPDMVQHDLQGRVLFMGAPALLIFAWFALGSQGPVLDRMWARLRFLGDSSYSIYLVHPFVLAVGAIVAGVVGFTRFGFWPLLIVLCLGSVAAGVVSYYIAERPLIGLAHKLLKNL